MENGVGHLSFQDCFFMFFSRTIVIPWVTLIHACFMLPVEFRCADSITLVRSCQGTTIVRMGVFKGAVSIHLSSTRLHEVFLQLQLLKLHHIFHDWVGFGWCVCPTSHRSGNIDRISTCHLPASMNIVFHSGNGFLSGHETSVQSGDYRLHSKQCTHAIYGVGGFYGESRSFLRIIKSRGLPNYPLTQPWLSFPAVLCQNTGNTGGRPHHFSQATTLSPCSSGPELCCWKKIDHKRPYIVPDMVPSK